jgi:hypothetical protein
VALSFRNGGCLAWFNWLDNRFGRIGALVAQNGERGYTAPARKLHSLDGLRGDAGTLRLTSTALHGPTWRTCGLLT